MSSGPAKIIGIAGGSGSGKTTIVRKISTIVPDFVFVPEDNYYKSADQIPQRRGEGDAALLGAASISNENIAEFNFDHPSAFDTELLYTHLSELKRMQPVDMPQYDFVRNMREATTIRLTPKKLIVFEGIMIFCDPQIRSLIDLKLYVDTPDDIRFIRRLRRDIEERGRTVDSVIRQYLEVVRPGHYQFIEPTKLYADLIVPEGGFNESAIQVLASFMRDIVG
ncbi:MAG TPA: uridine kinase [Spirochaetia bacterium]|nr:uridine kinase [Spirochaetia bacterium]